MIVETWAVLSLLIGGSLMVRTGGLRGAGVPVLGMLVGVGLHMIVALVQVVTPLPTTPVLTLAVVFLAPLAWWVWRWRHGVDVSISWRAATGVVVAVVALVAALRTLHLVTWHGDSVFYVLSGATLLNGHYYEAMTNEFFEKRPLGVPALHAVAGLNGEYYLASVTPLIAIAMVGTLIWLFRRGLRAELPRLTLVVFAVLGAALLVTSNRVVFHVFYLNGHLLTGAMVLAAAGALWLLMRGDTLVRPLVMVIVAAISTVVVTRAEGALTMLVVLAPALVVATISSRIRRLLVVWLGATMAAWFGFGIWVSWFNDEPLSASTAIQCVAGVALVAAAPLVGRPFLDRYPRRLLNGAEASLWLVLVCLAVASPAIAAESVTATVANQLGPGKWALTIMAVAGLVIAVVVALNVRDSTALRFPVTTFVPMVLVIAYARDGSYRVGMYDSLNRMWMQVLPLAVLYVIVALSSGEWKPWWRRTFRLAPQAPHARIVRESAER
jgi:hypothetical protein